MCNNTNGKLARTGDAIGEVYWRRIEDVHVVIIMTW